MKITAPGHQYGDSGSGGALFSSKSRSPPFLAIALIVLCNTTPSSPSLPSLHIYSSDSSSPHPLKLTLLFCIPRRFQDLLMLAARIFF
ncbi:unnamed protein product [Linum tenue]|uniref:Uncharacterized protein n=1 Tax=Linum tenue TaxID=586396 RepID=A0AAV0JCV5_9ROSI|nr:unnamed protein product [Linum tenue]